MFPTRHSFDWFMQFFSKLIDLIAGGGNKFRELIGRWGHWCCDCRQSISQCRDVQYVVHYKVYQAVINLVNCHKVRFTVGWWFWNDCANNNTEDKNTEIVNEKIYSSIKNDIFSLSSIFCSISFCPINYLTHYS